MQKLTEVFLMLAREDNKALTRDMVNLHDVLQEEVERARLLNRKPDIAINFHADNPLRLSSSDMVLSVLFGNLIRNSILYTDQGSIEVRLSGRDVFIEDSGRGMNQQQVGNMFRPYQRGENVNASGYGIGLTIVKRLTDRFHWPITVHSELDKGTRVKVSFPESSVG
jgi:signal transduction histidine kinase